VALPVPEIIGGTLIFGQYLDTLFNVQGHPMSLTLVPIEIAYATSC